ncbi:protein of unknown function [Candidatus Promineifilum breve]|uniref:Uncharacterized protein n=1 Tax=Candidatus Promineifilum breve TaxID=1806508 RepID=A0A160T3F7_9CHLR|nr:protein of unknown function [Candidatus Promineifilum breve]
MKKIRHYLGARKQVLAYFERFTANFGIEDIVPYS